MKKKKPKKDNSERWMFTYLDLITLLMIFFVVLYAMSNVDEAKYSQVSESLQGAFSGTKYMLGEGGAGQQKDGSDAQAIITEEIKNQVVKMASKTQQLQTDIHKYLKDNQLEGAVDLKVEQRGLVVSLKDSIFFESGSADIAPEYAEHMLKIGSILNNLNGDLVIEGHTDNIPIHNSLYASNWDLAAMRAINVIDLFVKKGGLDPAKLAATSYGEYRPLVSNGTKEGQAKNRRINIVVLSSEFYKENMKKQ